MRAGLSACRIAYAIPVETELIMREHRDAQLRLASNVDESQPPITRVCTNFECEYIATQWHAIARRSRTHARTLVFCAHDHNNRHQARS